MYTPESYQNYKGKQIILSSGRFIFNAKDDSIFLVSNKSVGIHTNESINMDTGNYFLLNSPKIYLGLLANNESEPILLGNTTRELILQLTKCLDKLAEALLQDPNITTAKIGAGYVKGAINSILTNYALNNKNSTILSKKSFIE